MTEIGARVWAVRDATDDVVYAYGFGTYAGDHLMPGWDHPDTIALCERASRRSADRAPLFNARSYAAAGVAEGSMTQGEADAMVARADAYEASEKAKPLSVRVRESAERLGMNPKIELDSGGWVWGAECWWGDADENTPAEWAKGRRIVTVPAPDRAGVA